MSWTLSLALMLLSWQYLHLAFGDDDDDDEIEGPLMPVKPDKSLYNTSELLEQYKYKAEVHKVTTDDSYILTIIRITPAKPNQPVILLQHGYLGSSDIMATGDDSPVSILSKAGYDMWICNSRGTAYSKAHAKYKIEDEQFWNFSWHEMGMYDIPAATDYILNKTGAKAINYIGHSMGTTMSIVTLTERPEYNKKFVSVVFMAPIVYLSKGPEMVGPDGMAAEYANKYMDQFKKAGKLEVFPRKDQDTNSSKQITCKDIEESLRDMCVDKMEEGYKLLGGAYIPAGQSFKTMEHLYQMSKYGVMKHFNYSAEENQKRYKSAEAPPYDMTKIAVPIGIWNAEADPAVQPKDMEDLVAKLGTNLKENNNIKEDCFDHFTYLFARSRSCIPVRKTVFAGIIKFLQKYNK